jgi:hypothetical protein
VLDVKKRPKLARYLDGVILTPALERLLKAVMGMAASVEDYALRARCFRRERRCVGCEEADGVVCYDVLGWVCESCDEVIDIVYEVEIERTREATEKVRAFIGDLEAGRI